jgi:hypothetical protein
MILRLRIISEAFFYIFITKISLMKKILLIIAIFAGLMAWQSCQYDWIEEEPVPESVSLAVDIIPIFISGCNSSVCHGSGGVKPDLTAENAYTSLFEENQIDLTVPENSILYKKMATGGSMNKYTSLGDSDLVLKWIQQGALNN